MANLRASMASISPILIFSCFSLLVGDMLFGYDTASFGGILANTASCPYTYTGALNRADVLHV